MAAIELAYARPEYTDELIETHEARLRWLSFMAAWTIEDLRRALKAQEAYWMCDPNDLDCGFLVLRTYTTDKGTPGAFVWLAWSNSVATTTAAFEWLIEILAATGFKELSFISPRRGWQRLAKHYGFVEREDAHFYREVV